MVEQQPDRPMGAILQDVMGDVSEIVRSEVKLAKAEVKEEITQLKGAMPMVAAGGVVAFWALGLAFTTVILALALVLPAWAAALIVFAFAAIVAAALLGMGTARIREIHKPERTLRTVQEGAEWLKTQTR